MGAQPPVRLLPVVRDRDAYDPAADLTAAEDVGRLDVSALRR